MIQTFRKKYFQAEISTLVEYSAETIILVKICIFRPKVHFHKGFLYQLISLKTTLETF